MDLCRNKLCNYVLAAGDEGLQLLQSRICHGVLQWGVYPHAIPPSPRLPPRNPAGHPVVEYSQHPPNAGGHHQRIQPVQQD